ncbi:hypothetical protein JAAARDRAFT_32197 [Jaapia argillacea MUCL 33604]|uniref:Peptide hydrolase n=1 Tax=Jaapia argillacea MUCL 33604 TaxID=933084 RepID=A0A067Q4W2_9AGAM|nr:hypothetical protein JAAARDRAFT_32197 [Jaapia argillacea MUCL 33604]
MAIRDHIAKLLAFKTIPTTVLAVVVYFLIFSSVLVVEEPHSIPKKQDGLNLTKAWQDLHAITAHPHPFISHFNDHVHSFLLTRLHQIASSSPAPVFIASDLTSNSTWALSASSTGVYFESTNILVKIPGTDPEYHDKDAVLFSAHYDSVSTAPGATDDGMGVVTLLQMVEYLSSREGRGTKTAIFNINNGEEDGLHGAHLFLEHPWSKICTSFFNLEGAAAGGRPLLFRTTSYSPTLSYTSHVPHPHTNVLSSDAYKRGVVRSYTDYQVYNQPFTSSDDGFERPGMEGLDLAFYKGRSKYHTKYDDVRDVEGGRRALWAMMESVKGAGVGLLNTTGKEEAGGDAVYFDLLGSYLVLFSLRSLIITDIILLVVGPILLVVLFLYIYTKNKQQRQSDPTTNGVHGTHESRLRNVLRKWPRGWGRFWVCVLVGVLAQVGLVVGYVKFNPFIIHSSPILVLLTSLSVSYLSLVLPLTLLSNPHPHLHIPTHPLSPARTKLTLTLSLYFLSYIFLLVATIAETRYGVGGLYWVTFWHVGVLLAGCVEGGEILWGRGHAGLGLGAEGEEVRRVRGVRFEVDGEEGEGEEGGREIVDEHPTEITPLIHQQRRVTEGGSEQVNGVIGNKSESAEDAIGWWMLQFVLSVPAPALLLSQMAMLLVGTLGQTLVDGSSARTVYTALCALSFLITLPLLPFLPKLHTSVTWILLLTFILTTLYTYTANPFSQEAPFKIFFQQTLTFNQTSSDFTALTSLTGSRSYLERGIVTELPSSWGQKVTCGEEDVLRPGLTTCVWEGGLLPSPGKHSQSSLSSPSDQKEQQPSLSAMVESSPSTTLSDWLEFDAKRVNGSSALISIRGVNTRACKIYFDNVNVTSFNVREGGTKGMQSGYPIPPEGLKELRLWSRDWEKKFEVEVSFTPSSSYSSSASSPHFTVEARAACSWAEYESGMAGVELPDDARRARIPAYEEVLAFLPTWAVATKRADALVEVSVPFKI